MYRFCVIVFLLFPLSASSQVFRPSGFEPKQNSFRKFFSKLELNIETGYARSYERHTVLESVLLQERGNNTYFFNAPNNAATNTSNYVSWANNVEGTVVSPTTQEQFRSDTTNISLTGNGWHIPFNFSVHVDIKRIRVGFGYNIVRQQFVEDFAVRNIPDIGSLPTHTKAIWNNRIYGFIGYSFKYYRYWIHTPELRIGKAKIKSLNEVDTGLFFDFGIAIEHHFSEYFRLRLRPSVEYLKYSGKNSFSNINVNRPSVQMTIGISINLPQFPRCPIKSCEATVNHAHPWKSDKEYRCNHHKFFQIQNPLYGENFRNKTKKKRK